MDNDALDRAKDTLEHAKDTVKDEAKQVGRHAKEAWEDLADEWHYRRELARARWQRKKRLADLYAHERPWELAGLALLTGALAALLLHRCGRQGCCHSPSRDRSP